MIQSIKRFFGITTETAVEAPVVKTARAYDRKEEGFLFSFAFPELAELIVPAQFHAFNEYIGIYGISETAVELFFPEAMNIKIDDNRIEFALDGVNVVIEINGDVIFDIAPTPTAKTVRLRRNSNRYIFEDDDNDICFLFWMLEDDDGYYESDISVSRDGIEFTSDEVSSMEDIEDMMASIEDQVELKETYEPDPIVEDEVELTESYTSDPIEDESDIVPEPTETTVVESSVEVEDTSDSTVESDTSY